MRGTPSLILLISPFWWFLIAFGAILLIFGLTEYLRQKAFDRSSTGTLVRAAKLGDADTVVKSLGEGANIDGLSPDGKSALHWAAVNGDIHIVKLLLDRGACVDGGYRRKSWDEKGFYEFIRASSAPLFWAVVKGHVEIADLLLERGANTTNVPKPFSAVVNGHVETIDARDRPLLMQPLYKIPVLYPAALKRDERLVRALLARGARVEEPLRVDWSITRRDSHYVDGLYVEKGVCPSVVKQLVKETIDGAGPHVCGACNSVGHGLSRDFVVYKSVRGLPRMSGTAWVTTTTSHVIDSQSFFVCDKCVGARSKSVGNSKLPSRRELGYTDTAMSVRGGKCAEDEPLEELARVWFERSHAASLHHWQQEAPSERRFGVQSAEAFFRSAELSR